MIALSDEKSQANGGCQGASFLHGSRNQLNIAK